MTIRLTHLVLLLAATTVLTTVGGVAATWWVADREFRDVLDDDLEQQSELLAELFARGDMPAAEADLGRLLADIFEDDDEETLWVTLYDLRTGRRISNLAHSVPLDDKEDGAVSVRYDDYTWDGYRERAGHVVVQLLRREDLYRDVREEVLEDIVMPVLLGSGATLLLLALFLGLTLHPLAKMSRELESRSAEVLEPLTFRTPAREIRVLQDTLNGLMQGIDTVIQRERSFASDVAHELRTPLTTLKLELASPRPDLATLRSEVERIARLVEQLLTLARLQQGQWLKRFERIELESLIERVAERFQERFQAAGQTLDLRLSPAAVTGEATLLEILLQNLLQNALDHCPQGTVVEVELDKAGNETRLRVRDSGPGIEAATREQMSRGFTRLDSKSTGFGLGLAICHRVVEAHGGMLRFPGRDDGRPGLVVEACFPA